LATIGCPIVPVPMNPTFMAVTPSERVARARPEAWVASYRRAWLRHARPPFNACAHSIRIRYRIRCVHSILDASRAALSSRAVLAPSRARLRGLLLMVIARWLAGSARPSAAWRWAPAWRRSGPSTSARSRSRDRRRRTSDHRPAWPGGRLLALGASLSYALYVVLATATASSLMRRSRMLRKKVPRSLSLRRVLAGFDGAGHGAAEGTVGDYRRVLARAARHHDEDVVG